MAIQDFDPLLRGAKTIVQGCPVEDGLSGGCCRNCGGGWPGTQISTEAMTRAVAEGTIDPNKLGCQPLQDRARAALEAQSDEAAAM